MTKRQRVSAHDFCFYYSWVPNTHFSLANFLIVSVVTQKWSFHELVSIKFPVVGHSIVFSSTVSSFLQFHRTNVQWIWRDLPFGFCPGPVILPDPDTVPFPSVLVGAFPSTPGIPKSKTYRHDLVMNNQSTVITVGSKTKLGNHF